MRDLYEQYDHCRRSLQDLRETGHDGCGRGGSGPSGGLATDSGAAAAHQSRLLQGASEEAKLPLPQGASKEGGSSAECSGPDPGAASSSPSTFKPQQTTHADAEQELEALRRLLREREEELDERDVAIEAVR